MFCFHKARQPAKLRPDMDNIIETKEVQIERKHFYVEVRENDRGRFLRITEEAHGRRNTIIVPSTGTNEFTAAIDDVLAATEQAPAYHFSRLGVPVPPGFTTSTDVCTDVYAQHRG